MCEKQQLSVEFMLWWCYLVTRVTTCGELLVGVLQA